MAEEHTPASAESSRLLDRLRDAIRRRHYSYRTEQAYVHWVRRFILHQGKAPPARPRCRR